MRVVVADCSVIYTGRGDTKLPRAVRALIVKSDGSVSVHNDRGTKPLNYMGKDCALTITSEEDYDMWSFDTRKESLQVKMYQIYSDSLLPLERSPEDVLERDGTESQLQEWIAANPECVGEGFTFVSREYPTGAGPVDILMKDAEGVFVAVEVKRVAMLGAVDQVSRYVEALKRDSGFTEVYGLIAALDVRPKTQDLAQKRGINWVTVPRSWRNGDFEVVSEDTDNPEII